MRVHLNPIMVGLLAAAPYSALAAGIDVTGGDPVYRGNNITLNVGTASDPATKSMPGLRVTAGGQAELTNSTITTLGDGGAAYGVVVMDPASLATLRDTAISTRGALSHGINATQGGRIDMHGGSLSTTGDHAFGAGASAGGSITLNGTSITTTGSNGSNGLTATGANSVITATDVAIVATGGMGNGIDATAGGSVTMQGGSISVQGSGARAVAISGNGLVVLNQAAVASANGNTGARVEGGRIEINGGSLSGGTSIYLGATRGGGATASAKVSNATLTAFGARAGFGIDLNAPRTSAVLDNVRITALDTFGGGVWMVGQDSVLSANVFDIQSTFVGIDNNSGQATLVDGSIQTRSDNAHGLHALRRSGASAAFDVTRVAIETQGDSAAGAMARQNGSRITLRDSSIITHGLSAYGLYASDAGASLVVSGSSVATKGDSAAGVLVRNRATAALDSTQISTEGSSAAGVWSTLDTAGQASAITIANGSRISTQDGVGLLAVGASHTFTVSDSAITARTGGDANNGVLLHSNFYRTITANGPVDLHSEQVTLNATNSVLSGNVVADSGNVDISLANGSVLSGALIQRGAGRINNLTLDGTSTWNVRGNSTLGTLTNPGVVAFTAPVGGSGFKTLTVGNYSGGGTLVLNTRLGDDSSATDRLVIDGGATTGTTSLRILNAGGAGGQTQTGIRVIETVNGGATAADAFRLDAGSTGYRPSAQTLALNGYEYSLVRGGNAGVASDWYLTSDYSGVTPPPDPIDPLVPIDPGQPIDPYRPITPVAPDLIDPAIPRVRPSFVNVSPESGAYLGNRIASSRFFTHSLHDRTPSYCQECPDASALDGGGDSATAGGRGLWTRVQGRQDSGVRMTQGRVDIGTDSAIVQLGGDLITAPIGQHGAVYTGLMGGYGNARSTATSTLMLAGGKTAQVRARGKVSGYAFGLYGTVYENDATRLGAYADTWLQYGRYSNQINSEVGAARYRSTAWSASLEAGYALKPFADSAALGPVVIQPHAQLVYSRYDAQDAKLPGTRMQSSQGNAWESRIGVRVYPQAKADSPAVRPFLEANWLHSFGTPSVNMGPNSLEAALSRNSLELKLGAEGRVSRAVQVSGHVFGQAGNNNQRGYGGMINLGYRW